MTPTPPPPPHERTLLHSETVGGRPLHLCRIGGDDPAIDGVRLRLVASDYAPQLRRRCTVALSSVGIYAATLLADFAPTLLLWNAGCVGVLCVLLLRIFWLVESGQ